MPIALGGRRFVIVVFTAPRPLPCLFTPSLSTVVSASFITTGTQIYMRFMLFSIAAALCCLAAPTDALAGELPDDGVFARDNLVAWCIVPFDAAKRGPEERAVMLERLGIRRLAYDYRAEHVPTFDAEVENAHAARH
ncbi:MAG: hypothetical protein R3C10_27535 [Pirellulales bacterium]